MTFETSAQTGTLGQKKRGQPEPLQRMVGTRGQVLPPPSPNGPLPRRRSGDGDFAAGPARHCTLSAPGFLPWFCCQIPGLHLFGLMALLLVAALFSLHLFYILTAVLTLYIVMYCASLTVFCTLGAWKMEKDSARDWHSLLTRLQQEDPENTDVSHIIILPNYKEDEQMLSHTLHNISRSPMARRCIRIVLAMEGREGPPGEQKAERLIRRHKHLFADMIAAYHPPGLSGEIAGKSSNTQWGFREALRAFAPIIGRLDSSRVLITVGDADTLWHTQYWSALAYEALTMPAHERCWMIFQPPVLLLRNLWTVPGITRVSAYGTFMFELAGLSNQFLGTHFAYSAYSMSLALASHPAVAGWDTDVIAEDHHMFCKCYFASIWEAVQARESTVDGTEQESIRSRVQLYPIFLPAISYLAESSDGWWASIVARFHQARRHSQGVAELSYVLLQYITLMRHVGIFKLPLRTHGSIGSIIWKMTTVHITNSVQAFALVCTAVLALQASLKWVMAGGVQTLMTLAAKVGFFSRCVSSFNDVFGSNGQALGLTFGCLPPIGLLTTITMYVVIKDVMEGRYSPDGLTEPVKEAAEGSERQAKDEVQEASTGEEVKAPPCRVVMHPLSLWQKVCLAGRIHIDMWTLAEPTTVTLGLIPVVMAALSLMWRGQEFEYIVANKPN